MLRPDGSLLAGDPGLAVPAPQGGAHHRFSRIEHQGQALRAVVLDQGTPVAYRVVIAQTTQARVLLLEQLLAYSLAPQLALLALLAGWLWRGIRRELHPLGALRRTLATRDAQDLAAVPVARSSRELEQLGDTLNALFERLTRGARACSASPCSWHAPIGRAWTSAGPGWRMRFGCWAMSR